MYWLLLLFSYLTPTHVQTSVATRRKMEEPSERLRVAVSPVQKLRDMLQEKSKIIVGPGIYDGLTARVTLHAGFDCLYMVGSWRSNARVHLLVSD